MKPLRDQEEVEEVDPEETSEEEEWVKRTK
jgi:hypothetical protein